MKEHEFITRNILNEMGVSSNYRGYYCVVHGISILLEDEERLQYITKDLYVDISKQCHCSIGSVERNIRTVKKLVWKKKRNHPIFQYIDECPRNGEFLALLLYEVQKTLYEKEQKHIS